MSCFLRVKGDVLNSPSLTKYIKEIVMPNEYNGAKQQSSGNKRKASLGWLKLDWSGFRQSYFKWV